jgi:hypothetical protein
MVKVIEWVMQIEEENMEDSYIPKWARMHGLNIEKDMENRSAVMECDQPISVNTGETRLRRTTVNW